MGDAAEASSNVPLPEDVVYTRRPKESEENKRVEEKARVPENERENESGEMNETEGVNNSKGSKSWRDELGKHIDIKA